MRYNKMVKIFFILMLVLFTIIYSSTKYSKENSILKLAPEFEAINDEGEKIRLKDFFGNYIIIYFFPRAFTPG